MLQKLYNHKMLKEPNKLTISTFEKTERGKELTECDSLKDMMRQLKIKSTCLPPEGKSG